MSSPDVIQLELGVGELAITQPWLQDSSGLQKSQVGTRTISPSSKAQEPRGNTTSAQTQTEFTTGAVTADTRVGLLTLCFNNKEQENIL